MRILDLAPSTKDFEIADVWLLTSQELIGCLLEEFMKINSVDDVASSINGFRLELSWSLLFIKHCTCHLNEGSVLALHDDVLQRCVWSKELMCDAQFIKIGVEAGILEFGAVVTSDVLDLDAIVGHGTIGESTEDILHFILVENYVHPCISRVIIDNDEAIEASSGSEGRVVSRAK